MQQSNLDLYNPLDTLIKIQRLRFKALVLPIIIILTGFFIYTFLKIDEAKYLSLAGLLYYVYISLLYHYRKQMPPLEKNIILSPINGRIVDVNEAERVVIIKKSLFNPADVRSTYDNIVVNFSIFSSKYIWLDQHAELAGKLVGIIPWKALCSCLIPDDYLIEVEKNQKAVAGETVLARLPIVSNSENKTKV